MATRKRLRDHYSTRFGSGFRYCTFCDSLILYPDVAPNVHLAACGKTLVVLTWEEGTEMWKEYEKEYGHE